MANASTLKQARAAKAKALKSLSALESAAVGITRIGGGYGLKVNLEKEPKSSLPSEVDGVPIRLEVVGRVRKRTDWKRARPLT